MIGVRQMLKDSVNSQLKLGGEKSQKQKHNEVNRFGLLI